MRWAGWSPFWRPRRTTLRLPMPWRWRNGASARSMTPPNGFRKRCRRFPANLRSSIQLARLRLSQRDLNGAVEVLTKATASAPKSPDAAVALGELYLLVNQPDHAEPEFRRAIGLDPKNGPALMGLAAIQIAAERMDQAEQTLRTVATLPGKEYKPQHALFLYRTGKQEEGLKELEALAKADPADRAARTRVVSAYVAMGKLPQARSLLEGVLKKNPKDTDALLQESSLFLRLGKTAEAQSDLQKVLHFTPNSAPAHLAMAGVHRLQGMAQSARQELSEAVRLDKSLLSARLELARTFAGKRPEECSSNSRRSAETAETASRGHCRTKLGAVEAAQLQRSPQQPG